MFVVASSHRTQTANRIAATERFYELLAEALQVRKTRKQTNVPVSAKRRRLEDKRRAGETRRLRRPVRHSDER